jgi:nitrite reductase/ring-hydroxylating ferredoxin subunit
METQPKTLSQIAMELDAVEEAISHSDEKSQELIARYRSSNREFVSLGLTTLVRELKKDSHGSELLMALLENPEIYSLFSIHGLLRANPAQQVLEVLEQVKPYLEKESISIEFIDYLDGVATLELPAAGCGSPTGDLIEGLTALMKNRVDGFIRISPKSPAQLATFIALDSLTMPRTEWLKGPKVDELATDRATFINSEKSPGAVAFRLNSGEIVVYENLCPHSQLPLREASCSYDTITCQWHGYEFSARDGGCFTESHLSLRKVPFKIVNGEIWISI